MKTENSKYNSTRIWYTKKETNYTPLLYKLVMTHYVIIGSFLFENLQKILQNPALLFLFKFWVK